MTGTVQPREQSGPGASKDVRCKAGVCLTGKRSGSFRGLI